MPDVEVRRSDPAGRYEAVVAGEVVGFAEFGQDRDVVVLPHTVIDDEVEGQGVGSALVRGVLDDLRKRGATVRPVCPFVRAWIEEHPDYQNLVAP